MTAEQAEVLAQYMEALVEASTIEHMDRIMQAASGDSDIENKVYRALCRLSKALIDKQGMLKDAPRGSWFSGPDGERVFVTHEQYVDSHGTAEEWQALYKRIRKKADTEHDDLPF